jgi:D-alanyl-D-alanine carboxypeptidase/D-alanyl-D-alanine-endopeptidase (penicillin-binding protein 4)
MNDRRPSHAHVYAADRRISRRNILGAGGAGLAAGALAIGGLDTVAARARPDTGGNAATPVADDLQAAIDAILADPRYAPSRLGLHVADRATGEQIFDIRGDEWFLAASTTKLFSGAAALDALGADYRFDTPVYRTGEIGADGTLDGDLILVASGDLTMGGRDTEDGEIAYTNFDHINAPGFPQFVLLTPQDPLAGLDDLARQVAEAGIAQISGEVIVDDRLVPTMAKDQYILTPIWINDNLIDLIVTPGDVGAAANLDWRPQSAAYQIDFDVETVAAGEPIDISLSSPAPNTIQLTGQIPEDQDQLVYIHQVDAPASHARTLLIEALARAGVTVTASPTGPNPADQLPAWDSYAAEDQVALHTSLPFSENLKLIQKNSHNQHADMQILLLALNQGKTTYDEGMLEVGKIVEKAGIDPAEMSLSDGRGSEYTDLFSPRTVTQLLAYMTTRPDYPAFSAALPILGVDGTEATTVPSTSPVAGMAAAKSGMIVAGDAMNQRYLIMARALAGYMTGRSGREVTFGIYLNNVPLAGLDEVLTVIHEHGAIVEAIYERV